MRGPVKHLREDERGSAIIEFAILAPVIIMFLIGTVQVAVLVQSYNAMRSVASDTARYAVVEYQKKNEVSNASLKSYAEALGQGNRYQMQSGFTATIVNAGTQRVTGATEKTLTLTYTPPGFMPLVDWVSPNLTFSRPIFVIDE